VGISGGNSGARESSYGIPFIRFPQLENPVQTSISMFMWTDAIERGPEMTAKRDGVQGKDKLDVPIKFIWNYASNTLINQHSQINRTHDILQDESKCEMIVTIDNHMTSTAKYSDILLPDLTTSEQDDFCMDGSASNMNYVIFAQKAIEPQFECRGIYQMCSELAEHLGVKDKFTEGRTQEEWLEHMYALSRKENPKLPTYEDFRKNGIYKEKDPNGHFVAYKAFRDDPVKNALSTESGKIEIYSEALAKISAEWELPKGEVIDPLPIHVSTLEGWDDVEGKKTYPLQMIGFHYKARTHSTYGNVELLAKAAPQELWINPIDAKTRNIAHGDLLAVFNARGKTNVAAKVTPRIIPGVVALSEGAWFTPDEKGVDQNGSINILTTQRPSPLAKGNPSHTNLVEVTKAV
ncbi:MAG: molybdopterin dinucleotide binding domain-containing protein, partial [Saezia sp.]